MAEDQPGRRGDEPIEPSAVESDEPKPFIDDIVSRRNILEAAHRDLQRTIEGTNQLANPVEHRLDLINFIYGHIVANQQMDAMKSLFTDKNVARMGDVMRNMAVPDGVKVGPISSPLEDAYRPWIELVYRTAEVLFEVVANDPSPKVKDLAMRVITSLRTDGLPISSRIHLSVLKGEKERELIANEAEEESEARDYRELIKSNAAYSLVDRYNAQREMGIQHDAHLFAAFSHPNLPRYRFEPEMRVSDEIAEETRDIVRQWLDDESDPKQQIYALKLTSRLRDNQALPSVLKITRRAYEASTLKTGDTYRAREDWETVRGNLSRFGTIEALKALVDEYRTPIEGEGLNPEAYQQAILETIAGYSDHPDYVEPLLQLLDDSDERLSLMALKNLRRMSSYACEKPGEPIVGDIFPRVSGIMPKHVNARRKDDAWQALTASVFPGLIQRLETEQDQAKRSIMLQTIATGVASEASFNVLPTLSAELEIEPEQPLQPEDIKDHTAIIAGLEVGIDRAERTKEEADNSQALKTIFAILKHLLAHSDLSVKVRVAQIYTTHPDRSAVALLKPLLFEGADTQNYDGDFVCNTVATALAEIGDPNAVDAFIDALRQFDDSNDPHKARRNQALSGLAKIISKGGVIIDPRIEPLFQTVLDDDEMSRTAAGVLARIGNPENLPSLHELLLKAQSTRERDRLMETITTLGQEDSIEPIRAQYESEPTESGFFCLAMLTISQHVSPEKRVELREYLDDPAHQLRVKYRSQDIVAQEGHRQWVSAFTNGMTADTNARINLAHHIISGENLQYENESELEYMAKLCKRYQTIIDPLSPRYLYLTQVAQWERS